MRIFLCVVIYLILATCVSRADQLWQVAGISTDQWLPSSIMLSFDGSNLKINNARIYQPGGSSAWSRTLQINGTWAVFGYVDNYGNLVKDPYACFVHDSYDSAALYNRTPTKDSHGIYATWVDQWTSLGHIEWNADTPADYTATMLLGTSFTDNGAVTYNYQNARWSRMATGTLVLDDYYNYYGGYSGVDLYSAASHSFSITYAAPEFAAPALFLMGLGCVAMRRRR